MGRLQVSVLWYLYIRHEEWAFLKNLWIQWVLFYLVCLDVVSELMDVNVNGIKLLWAMCPWMWINNENCIYIELWCALMMQNHFLFEIVIFSSLSQHFFCYWIFVNFSLHWVPICAFFMGVSVVLVLNLIQIFNWFFPSVVDFHMSSI